MYDALFYKKIYLAYSKKNKKEYKNIFFIFKKIVQNIFQSFSNILLEFYKIFTGCFEISLRYLVDEIY